MLLHSRWRSVLAASIVLFVVALLLFGRGMDRDLNHDEHQFLAPGALLAREGLLPYRDYPLFHLPNLVFIYAALDWITGWPVLSAKIFSVLCSFAFIALIFCTSTQRARAAPFRWPLAIGVSVIALLIFDPLFLFTSGKTWNHEFPTCMMICGIALQVIAAQKRSPLLFGLSGMCVSAAVGARLTFLPILPPLLLMAWLSQEERRSRMTVCATWSIGVLVALVPTFWLWAKAPDAFLFDNFQFPKLRLLDPENTRIQKTATVWRKLRFLFKEVALPSWPLFLVFLGSVLPPAWRWWKARQRKDYPCAVVLLTVPFLIAGCFAPSRYQYQHLFALNCLLALGAAYGCSFLLEGRHSARFAFILASLGLITAFGAIPGRSEAELRNRPAGFWAYAAARDVFRPREWFGVRVHQRSQQLREHTEAGPVLTLAPTWPIEAGLRFYPEFATGSFAWRSAHLMPEQQRQKLHFVAPDDLPKLLERRPPAAILIGVEDEKLEEPLLAYARAAGYSRIAFSKRQQLWVRPKDVAFQSSEETRDKPVKD